MRINVAKEETKVFSGSGLDYSYIDLSNSEGLCAHVNMTLNSYAAKITYSEIKSYLLNQYITYTSKLVGTLGDAITIAYTTGGTAGAEEVTVVVQAISVKVESGVSTTTQVKAAVDAYGAATALVGLVITGGQEATAVTAPLAATNLANGRNSGLNLTANTFTPTVAHGYATGAKGQFTTTGSLPTGVSTSHDYWIIKTSDSAFQVADSMALAIAGTAIDISAEGSGNHTFTPVASAGNLYVGATNSLSLTPAALASAFTSGNNSYHGIVYSRYAIVYGAATSGTITAVINMVGKGLPNE